MNVIGGLLKTPHLPLMEALSMCVKDLTDIFFVQFISEIFTESHRI